MNKRFITGVFILASFSILSGKCYSCDKDPTAVISGSDPRNVCVGETENFNGTSSHDNDEGGSSIVGYQWSCPGASVASPTASSTNITFGSYGSYTVTLTVTDDESATDNETCQVYSIAVTSVSQDKTVACTDEDVTFTATPTPSGEPLDCIEWQKRYKEKSTDDWGDWEGASGGDNTAELNTDVAGLYQYQARNGSGDTWKESSEVAVVEVKSLLPDAGTEFDDGDDNPDTKSFSVCIGNVGVVTVTATPNPDVSEDNLPDCWMLTGGSGTGELTRTVDKTSAGITQISCTCNDSSKTTKIYVVEVDKIEIFTNGNWYDVTDDSIVVLKGTKYTFKAFPNPSTASWPTDTPEWSGVETGTGESIEVTFGSAGTYSLTSKCGPDDTGKKVTIDVIVPELNTVEYFGNHQIYDVASPEYRRDPYRNEPACWTMGANASSKVTFWHSQDLTFPTENIIVRAETSGDHWNIADWGDSSPSTFGTPWPTDEILCISEGTINSQVEYRDYSADWKYKVPWGTNDWITTTTTQNNCRLYVVLDTPTAPQAQPWKEVLDQACGSIANGADTKSYAMYLVWNRLCACGGVYDTAGGESSYAGQSSSGNFKLSSWLTSYPSVGTVNCHDMAQAEVIYANALGCGAVYSFAGYPYDSSFGYLNCIEPIGCGWTNNPFYGYGPPINPNSIVDGDWSIADGRSSFSNHSFARLNGNIYDACNRCVDVDLDPDDGPIHFPYRYLDGSDSWTDNYRNRVIDDIPASYVGSPIDMSFGVDPE